MHANKLVWNRKPFGDSQGPENILVGYEGDVLPDTGKPCPNFLPALSKAPRTDIPLGKQRFVLEECIAVIESHIKVFEDPNTITDPVGKAFWVGGGKSLIASLKQALARLDGKA